MPKMVCVCTNKMCNIAFESPIFSFGMHANISFHNVNTTCPKCGSVAAFLDGEFYSDKYGNLSVKSGSKKTREIISKLREVKKKLDNKDNIEISEILHDAGIIGTTLEKPIYYLAKKKGLSTALTLLIAFFIAIENLNGLNINEFFDQFLIACHLVTKEEAQELIDLRKASSNKEGSPHVDAKNEDGEESIPAASKPKQKRPKKPQAVPQKERRREIIAARKQRCPSQAPKSR